MGKPAERYASISRTQREALFGQTVEAVLKDMREGRYTQTQAIEIIKKEAEEKLGLDRGLHAR